MQSISPLRYPGGKSRLYTKVEPLVTSNNFTSYAEPFSGGFGIGLLLLKNNKVNHVYINDLDRNIYSFWKVITTDFKFIKKNIKRVTNFNSYEEWMSEREEQKQILNSNRFGYKRKGFATLFLNRVNRSGILSAGPIGGKHQEGKYKVNCRFNPTRLLEQIEWIYSQRQYITVSNDNYDVFIDSLNNDVFIFLDPPYVIKGGNLYMNNFKGNDHVKLRDFLLNINKSWIMTYDCDNLIMSIYSDKHLHLREFDLQHYAGKYKVGKEIFISNKFLI